MTVTARPGKALAVELVVLTALLAGSNKPSAAGASRAVSWFD